MSRRKQRKEEEERQHDFELARRHREMLVEQLDEAKTFTGADISEVPGCPLQAHAGERVFLSADGAFLIEPRRGAGHWEGVSQGISVHVPGTRSMRYRVGANRGTFVQGEEQPTPIDRGTFVITTQRAVFIGAKQTREWLWSKLIGFTHSADAAWTAIAVSNRQKTSGVLYDDANTDRVRFLLDLAAARSAGTTDTLLAQIEGELAALPSDTATELTAAAPAGDASVKLPPAAWCPDPTGKHELRYWNGTEWTEHVADAGVQADDSISGGE